MELVVLAAVIVALIASNTILATRRSPDPKPVIETKPLPAELAVMVKQATDAMAALIESTHAAHKANVETLMRRNERLQTERDHYFQQATQFVAELQRHEVKAEVIEPPVEDGKPYAGPENPAPPTVQTHDGVEGG